MRVVGAVRLGAAVLSAMTLVLTVGSAAGYRLVTGAESNIQVDPEIPVEPQDDGVQPVDPTTGLRAENILIVGSDTRTGQGSGFGNADNTSSGNGSSDTTILLHISADRTFAYGVSIPRDSWVTRPGCEADGTVDDTTVTGKFNAAYAVGGRKCVVAAVKYLTGVPITHFVEVRMLGVEKIVDALGGVQIDACKRIYDPKRQDANGDWHGSGVDIPKGEHTLDGATSMQLLRSRNLADADLGRIHRQQQFLSSVIRTASETGLLTDPVRLLSVLSAVTDSLTVDKGLSGDALNEFLVGLASLKPSEISFYSVPNVAKGDGENVLWKTDEADVMWQAMKDDAPYPPAGGKKGPDGASQPALTVAPDAVSVQVLNGTTTAGLGQKAAKALTKAGFQVTSVGNTKSRDATTTTMTYDPAWDVSARTLEWMADATGTAVPGQGRTMVLTVGSDWAGVRKATISDPSTKPQNAADTTCIS